MHTRNVLVVLYICKMFHQTQQRVNIITAIVYKHCLVSQKSRDVNDTYSHSNAEKIPEKRDRGKKTAAFRENQLVKHEFLSLSISISAPES